MRVTSDNGEPTEATHGLGESMLLVAASGALVLLFLFRVKRNKPPILDFRGGGGGGVGGVLSSKQTTDVRVGGEGVLSRIFVEGPIHKKVGTPSRSCGHGRLKSCPRALIALEVGRLQRAA